MCLLLLSQPNPPLSLPCHPALQAEGCPYNHVQAGWDWRAQVCGQRLLPLQPTISRLLRLKGVIPHAPHANACLHVSCVASTKSAAHMRGVV